MATTIDEVLIPMDLWTVHAHAWSEALTSFLWIRKYQKSSINVAHQFDWFPWLLCHEKLVYYFYFFFSRHQVSVLQSTEMIAGVARKELPIWLPSKNSLCIVYYFPSSHISHHQCLQPHRRVSIMLACAHASYGVHYATHFQARPRYLLLATPALETIRSVPRARPWPLRQRGLEPSFSSTLPDVTQKTTWLTIEY